MYSYTADFPVSLKRMNQFECDSKSVAKGGVFHVVRERDISRVQKKRNLSVYWYSAQEHGETTFRPSRGAVLCVQDSIVKARREQHSVVKQWLNGLKTLMSGKSVQFEEMHSTEDSLSLPATHRWLSQKIAYYMDNIGTSASQNGLATYYLTENGMLRPEVAQMLAKRLGVSSDGSYRLVSLLRDDLWRAGLDKSIAGSWGTLAILEGELVVDTSAKGRLQSVRAPGDLSY